MARLRLFTDEQWAALLAPPRDEREIVRHYTLNRDDLDLIGTRHSDHGRLGFAVLLCYLRYPGRAPEPGEVPPPEVLEYVAGQLEISPGAYERYRRRGQTRREQLAVLMARTGHRHFSASEARRVLAWLIPVAQTEWRPEKLVGLTLEELRRSRILAPTPLILELLIRRARTRADIISQSALTADLPVEKAATLDALLTLKADTSMSILAWLHRAPRAPTGGNILGVIERILLLRDLGIERERRRNIPAAAFERLAAEALRMTPQHLRELPAPRRHAALTAAVIALESDLTDAVLHMFDKRMGTLSRRAERQTADNSLVALRLAQNNLRRLAAAGRAIIDARAGGTDPFSAIEGRIGWDQFVDGVAQAEALAHPDTTDGRAEFIKKYGSVRVFAPALLRTFEFRGSGSAGTLLRAVALIDELYRSGARALPSSVPTGFVRRAWRPFVFRDGTIDRKAYELCALSELRDRLRAGDVWVAGSRQYQDFESYLIPGATFDALRREGPLPLEIGDDADTWLKGREDALGSAMTEVAGLAANRKLEDVDLSGGELKIAPLRNAVPEAAEALRDAAYDTLPRAKITDVLLDVDHWTGFTKSFVHQRSGRPAENREALLAAILADGINLGLTSMADACRDVTLRQMAWAHDWHIREQTYAAALANLIEFHRALPLARQWGSGATSSSDGQYFQAGGHGEGIGDINARHGNEPGVSFYTHISDQYGPFHTKVIAAAASEAPHVLDGLLCHQTGLRIEEHYVDTGGVTDHVFGLCPMFGIHFAPRIRDLRDRRLYLFPGQAAPPLIAPLIDGHIDRRRVTSHWNDLLRLGVSIRAGTVSASAILRKLSAYPRQNGLAVALRELGRVERTLFTLNWMKSTELRRRANAGLNKGEARNSLARAIFFYRLGEMRDRSFESQAFRASGLNFLVAAIIIWNTVYLERALDELRGRGRNVSPDLIRHVAPLGWEHIGLTGDYVWTRDGQPGDGAFRPLRQRVSMLAA